MTVEEGHRELARLALEHGRGLSTRKRAVLVAAAEPELARRTLGDLQCHRQHQPSARLLVEAWERERLPCR